MRRSPVTIPLLALGLFVTFVTGSCVQIEGGAIEISWKLFANGRAVTECSCSDPEVVSMRLDVVGMNGSIAGSMPCAGRPECVFPCQRQTGATPFDIPETHGDEVFAIKLVAVDRDGADLPMVRTPDEIERAVVRGQPTEVEAVEVDVGCATACENLNMSGVCARP
jgi:hypothetical protein